jgi:hypothetical protein
VSQPLPRTPVPVDRQTQEQIAGTAVLLLERFCRDQPRGQRVFEGKRFYTIVESGRNLNIEFKGDAHHLPETILTLRTQQVNGQTLYEIESWLTQEDVQRFALIRQEFQRDLVNSERTHEIERP